MATHGVWDQYALSCCLSHSLPLRCLCCWHLLFLCCWHTTRRTHTQHDMALRRFRPKDEDERAAVEVTQMGTPHPLPPWGAAGERTRAGDILQTLLVLRGRAISIMDGHCRRMNFTMFPNAVTRFGPLTEGIQVKAALVLNRIGRGLCKLSERWQR